MTNLHKPKCLLVALAGLLLWSFGALAEHYTVPLLVPAGTTSEPQGVLRILNATDESGTVEIYAIGDDGTRSGPAAFTLSTSAAVEFTATDLASGNATLGLTGGIGTEVGDARLQIETDLDIVPLAFVRAVDGTLSAIHDTVRGAASDGLSGYTYNVPVFNPSTEMTQVSRLRLINPGDAAAAVTIGGRDDSAAEAVMGDVTLALAAGGAKTLTAQQLEAGDTDLTGQLGAGTGKWRLTVSSDQPLEVVNIVASTAGYWNNLSTTAVAGAAPADEAGFNERFVGNSVIYETSGARSTLEAADGNRFTDTVEADGVTETYMGSYSYRAIGPDAGLLTLDYDDGDACRANLYFSSRTSGWFASHCTGSDYPAEGSWLGGTWVAEDDDDDGTGDVTETTYEVNDALAGVPTSGSFAPSIIGGGSLQFTGSGTTIGLNNGAYFELNDGTRYTCTTANGCTIVNGTVTAGTVTGRAPGAGEVDRFPSFRTAAAPGNQTYTVGTAIETLTLPEAAGGNGDLTYSLSPNVPGLTFNATTRQLTGTPSAAGTHAMTYTVTDEDGDSDTLSFTLSVEESADGGNDNAALMALYNATDGANWSRSDNWGTDAPLDRWYGITVDRNGRVIRLDLRGNQLSGPIPAELGNLVNLESLWLNINQLSGPIPTEFGNLANLERLVLRDNQLSGPIPPQLGNLANLRWLWLEDNQLSGPIPAQLGNLANFVTLRLSGNQLSGPIPAQLGNLANLEWLVLSNNQLSGPIPAELGNLADLLALRLNENQLSGPIPAQLGNLTNLVTLFLYENRLSGPIPAELGNLANLVSLWLSRNQLSGPIPAELGNLANLESLFLEENRLSGPIPAQLGNIANLEVLWLNRNQLSGPIPAQLGNPANLRSLFLQGNQLSGCIPDGLRDVRSSDLSRLDLAFCEDDTMDGETSYEVGDEIATLPTGSWSPDMTTGGSFSLSGGDVVVRLDNGGNIEVGDYRFRCQSAGGCEIRNRQVVSGTIVQSSTTAMPEDTQPSFTTSSGPGNQSYEVGTAIATLTLPEATGGNGDLTYSLSPSVPGLTFNATARQLTGTPSAAGTYAMTYTVTDEDGDTDTLNFSIDVAESDEGAGAADSFGLDVDGGNGRAVGIVYANERLYVVDSISDKVFAYSASGQREATSDFDLDDANVLPDGIAYVNERFYVVDWFRQKVYVYTASGQRDSTADFDLDDDSGSADGIAFANGRFYVVDRSDNKVYAYSASGQRDAAADFDLLDDFAFAVGMDFADGRFYLVSSFRDKVYAYTESGQYDAAGDFDLHEDNNRPDGIGYGNDRFYVVDAASDRVYAYAGAPEPEDTSPSFAADAGPGDKTYTVGTAIDTLALPEASGGDGTLTYSLSPEVPGLSFDAATRELTGTPTAAGTYAMTYTATDEDGDAGSLNFSIAVEASDDGGESAGTSYSVDDSLPGVPTSGTFAPSITGGGSLILTGSGTTITLNNGAYFELNDGTRYTCTSPDGCTIVNGAVTQGTVDGRASSGTMEPEDTSPSFATDAGPGNQMYTVGTAIATLTLPEASDGDGTLTYSLSPEVPGLSFNATTRQLTGTPSAAATHAMTYTVTDEDSDSDTLSFTLTVEESDDGGNDIAALMALYNATGGANWNRTDNWGTDAGLDQWEGVSVDRNGRVIGLNLTDNQLSGPIPGELGNLTNLETLNLARNQLSGPIPGELGNLANLETLVLDDNQLSGPIPAQLGNLANLESLALDENQLSGPIPAQLGNLANLETLVLDENQLSGPIPAELGNLANLEILRLGFNQLSGPIPAQLGNLANLQSLFLDENQLSGPIPAQLGNLANLEVLWLSRNQLSGPIPAQLGNLANLESLALDDNQLSGPIPAQLGNLANVFWLNLTGNQLAGPIPAELGNLANLENLYLNSNQLSGPIPAQLGNLANLEVLWLSGNQLSGPIPAQLGNLANLQWLLLRGNQLSGCIPDGLRDVRTNDLSGLGLTFCGDVTMDGETSYGVGDEIATLPTGSWTPDMTLDGSFSLSGGDVVVRLDNGGYIEVGDYRFRCQSAGGCEIRNRQVVSGTIVQSSTTTMPEDTQPSFTSSSGPGNQSYEVGTAIDTLTLPEASGGDGTLTYSLSPEVPGLSFNAAARQLTGTPSAAGTYAMTYTVTDEDGDTDSLRFTVTVTGSSVPTDTTYERLDLIQISPGRVRFSILSAGGCITFGTTTINGVSYSIVSSKWQTRADSASAWSDIAGTERTGQLCSLNPTASGQYRLVAEITISGTTGNYSSNILSI